MNQLNLAATALRSCFLLSAIYEFKQDWVHTVKAKLLQNNSDPFELLEIYLQKVLSEDEAAQIIYACLLYSMKLGLSRLQFREKVNSYKQLVEYIINNY